MLLMSLSLQKIQISRDFFIIKPRHTDRLKKQIWVEKNPQWEPWSHAAKHLLPYIEVNIWRFLAVLYRNNDQEYNNPLASFATCLCRQRSEHERTAHLR